MSLADTINTLYQDYGQVKGVTIECQNELVAIGINNTAATAEVFLQGAQVTRFQQTNKAPLLFLSDACRYQNGAALRGGIPICWPWFGDLQKNPMALQQQLPADQREAAPAHGFIRHRLWDVKSITTPTDALTIIELTYNTNGDEPLWPYKTQLIYRVEVGERLSASLSIHNNGNEAFICSGALHTYCAVDHIEHVRLKGFDQATYIDAIDHWNSKSQQGDIGFSGEVDRIYQAACIAATINDGDRTINVSSIGSNSTVVWNPWIDKSQRLSQFKANDYQRMLCIETANVLDDAICIEAGEKHLLGVHLF